MVLYPVAGRQKKREQSFGGMEGIFPAVGNNSKEQKIERKKQEKHITFIQ